mmetsp:Transcript_9676/g.32825  ORF Transcript_9676/g.32825 Transcript_9676/m.32825 type:complete len:266 (-) Transcript_9676:415-1212(-)
MGASHELRKLDVLHQNVCVVRVGQLPLHSRIGARSSRGARERQPLPDLPHAGHDHGSQGEHRAQVEREGPDGHGQELLPLEHRRVEREAEGRDAVEHRRDRPLHFGLVGGRHAERHGRHEDRRAREGEREERDGGEEEGLVQLSEVQEGETRQHDAPAHGKVPVLPEAPLQLRRAHHRRERRRQDGEADVAEALLGPLVHDQQPARYNGPARYAQDGEAAHHHRPAEGASGDRLHGRREAHGQRRVLPAAATLRVPDVAGGHARG